MNYQNLSKLIMIIIPSIIIGIILGQLEIFSQIKAVIILTVIFVISLITTLVSKSGKNRNFGRIMLGSVILAGVIMLLSTSFKISNQKKTANEIILKLKDFKSKNGVYPKKLETKEENDKYTYYVDSTKKNFKLRYIVDGWHYREYSSETNDWVISD